MSEVLNVTLSDAEGVLAPTNTRVLTSEFDYARPQSVEQACAELAEHGEGARLIAGGTDVLVQLKMERFDVTRLISLAGIAELNAISSDSGLSIGATTSVRQVAQSELVRERYTALAEACDVFSTVPIMVMATVGGNICNASPASDTAPALLAFDAEADLVSASGSRKVALSELFTGPGKTVIAADELLRSVHVPEAGADSGSAFIKVGRVTADISKVAAAVRIVRDGAKIADVRIALGSVAPTPLLVAEAAASLRGKPATVALFDEAAHVAAAESAPITDVRSTDQYRRRIVATIVRDALGTAWTRAGGKEIS